VNGITTHVLDLARGVPGAGIAVRLDQAHADGWRELAAALTDADGRVREWPGAPGLAPGAHRLTFATAALTPFYPEISVVFDVTDAGAHYHVPLLLSPFGYSTYRGS
jgi:5-hydroxyisourate hydrolase